MLATYGHMSNKSTDDILLKHAGVKRGRPKAESVLKARQCPYCQTVNAPTFDFCGKCGRSLTAEAESEIDEVRRFAKSPEKLRMLADELEQVQMRGSNQ